MWATVKRYAVITFILLLLIGVGIVALQEYRQNLALYKVLEAKTTELQQSKLDLGRAETKIGDANLMINKLNKDIQDEIVKRQAVVDLYAALEASYRAEKNKVKILTTIVYRDQEIPIQAGKIFMKTDDGKYQEVTSMKFNYNDFRISVIGDAVKQELSYSLHQKFRGVFAETKLPGGGFNHYAEIYELDDKGKDVGRLTLTNFKVVRSEELKPKMWWFNPKIDLSAGYVYSPIGHGATVDVGVSFSSYGSTPNDISWRFFRVGVGAHFGKNTNLQVNLVPASYNIARNLPLVSNIWLQPQVGFTVYPDPSWLAGGAISVVF